MMMPLAHSTPFIMVAGTGRRELIREELRLARSVGKRLAREGFGLITCGWPGIDAAVSESFAEALAAEERPRLLKQYIYPRHTLDTIYRGLLDGDLASRFLKTLVCDPRYVSDAVRRAPGFLGGQLIEVGSEDEEYACVAQAAAVVLIGGMSGTMRVAEMAERLGKPVLPLSTQDGASRALYQRLIAGGSAPGRFSAAQLQGLIGDRDTVVANLMRLLHFVLGFTDGGGGSPVHLYVSHVPEDEAHCSRLLTHLRLLQRQGRIIPSRRRDIDPGATLATAVQEHLCRAEIVILLVSADYIACNTCAAEELGPALERHRSGEATVLPVLLSPVADLSPLDGLRPMPEGTWLSQHGSPDAVWAEVTQRVAQAVAARAP